MGTPAADSVQGSTSTVEFAGAGTAAAVVVALPEEA
jgi:hypothetical protein